MCCHLCTAGHWVSWFMRCYKWRVPFANVGTVVSSGLRLHGCHRGMLDARSVQTCYVVVAVEKLTLHYVEPQSQSLSCSISRCVLCLQSTNFDFGSFDCVFAFACSCWQIFVDMALVDASRRPTPAQTVSLLGGLIWLDPVASHPSSSLDERCDIKFVVVV